MFLLKCMFSKEYNSNFMKLIIKLMFQKITYYSGYQLREELIFRKTSVKCFGQILNFRMTINIGLKLTKTNKFFLHMLSLMVNLV